VTRRRLPLRHRLHKEAAGFASAILLAVSACRQSQPTAAPAPLPAPTRGYILISIDTLRADHLGLYGYPKPTSPFLDELAHRANVFDEAYSQFPSTLVSHMTMFTGLYPREHGVLPPNAALSPAIETLPEIFAGAGFRTGGFTEGGFMSGRFGFRRGFDTFVSHDRNRDRPLEGTFRRAGQYLADLGPKDRFFVFVHTYAVHTPYDAPERYQRMFWSGPPPPGAIAPTGPALVRANMSPDRPTKLVVDQLIAQYDAGIRQTDDTLRAFFAELDRLGLTRDTTILLTADHGEEFQEHGLFTHLQVYRESLHVPLLVVAPGLAPERHPGVVQLVDIAPTLCSLARLKPRQPMSSPGFGPRLGRTPVAARGSARAEALDGTQALYEGSRPALENVVLYAPRPEAWFPLRLGFDAPRGILRFEARSYLEPHTLTIRRGSEVLAHVPLTTTWKPISVSVPASRVVLEADDCTIVPDDEDVREPRCFAFQVKGFEPRRIEYYDLSRDLLQQHDLAGGTGRLPRDLLRDLLAFQPRPLAGTPTRPSLDPELIRSLRALGYVH
jgi:arylsulfatase A-like enzyme